VDKDRYLEYFRDNREAILASMDGDLTQPVKGCPAWTRGDLLIHVGSVYQFWLKWIHDRPQGYTETSGSELQAQREAALPGYTAWAQATDPNRPVPSGYLDFVRTGGEALAQELATLDPDEQVWTFAPEQQNAAFVFRRIAQETGVHRWDAENATGRTRPIDAYLARDGIDEILSLLPAFNHKADASSPRMGQRARLRERGDGGRTWLVRFDSERMAVLPDDTAAVAFEVHGSASDVLLYIFGRLTVDEVEVVGDRELASQWGLLAGHF
jgi:uncharacterized protein (TIGR03083 family)